MRIVERTTLVNRIKTHQPTPTLTFPNHLKGARSIFLGIPWALRDLFSPQFALLLYISQKTKNY